MEAASMLLFLLRDNLPERSYVPQPVAPAKGGYALELLASGLSLSAWCVLRLASAHGESFAVDSALALPCLALGLWVILRSVRRLGANARRGRPGKKSPHIDRRAQRRRQRVQRAKGRF
jgi:hypothetical protein